MKTLFLTVLISTTTGLQAACAAPPAAKHWAAGSVARLSQKKIMTALPDGQFHGDQLVTRYELAVTLDRLVRYLEAGRNPLSAPVPKVTVALPAGTDKATRQALAHLAQGGFISSHSPLLQTNRAVTAQELADILAQITIRLSDRRLPPTSH